MIHEENPDLSVQFLIAGFVVVCTVNCKHLRVDERKRPEGGVGEPVSPIAPEDDLDHDGGAQTRRKNQSFRPGPALLALFIKYIQHYIDKPRPPAVSLKGRRRAGHRWV